MKKKISFFTMKNRVDWNHTTLQLKLKKKFIYNYYVILS
jgi:hypothetical protein